MPSKPFSHTTLVHYLSTLQRYSGRCILFSLGAFFCFELFLSLSWRMQHDTPLYYYIALTINKWGYVPYQDILETSMPGTFLLHVILTKLFGYSDLAFRITDIISLLLLLFATHRLMRCFGKTAAFFAALGFGLLYMGLGTKMSFQRDYLGLIPIAFAIVCAQSYKLNTNWRFFLIGFLYGAACSIKPHLGLTLPFVVIYAHHLDNNHYHFFSLPKSTRQLIPLLFFTGTGFFCSFAVPFIWLANINTLPAFWEMFSKFLPLHIQLNGAHTLLSPEEHRHYLLASYLELGGYRSILYGALLAVIYSWYITPKQSPQHLLLNLLTCCTLAYSIYPVLSGQFWIYHWIPFLYCLVLLCSLWFTQIGTSANANTPHNPAVSEPIIKNIAIKFLFICAVSATLLQLLPHIMPKGNLGRQLLGQELRAPRFGWPDLYADFLQQNLKPGEKVQVLDWVGGGSIHGLLLAQAPLATRYMHDYQFYHHVSSPYTQLLRRDFIEQLQQTLPQFIFDIHHKGKPNGLDTDLSFPELDQLLAQHYQLLPEISSSEFSIYERIND